MDKKFYRHPDDADGDWDLDGEDCIQKLKMDYPNNWREVMRTLNVRYFLKMYCSSIVVYLL